jgi:adenine-specific DNA-methyltransferase
MPFLNWINKHQAVATCDTVPYHLLKHQKSYGDISAATDNLIIQGDNLQALKALLPFYTGKVKCIYIDPPYNTQSAFEHYDDKLEHSQWLSMMYPRLVLLRELLSDDGSIWVSLDDREAHYFKVMMDEIFGRGNFVTSIAWQQRTTRENRKTFSANHEYLLLYAKSYSFFASSRNDLELTNEVIERYKNPDSDPRGVWQSVSANAQAGHATASQFYILTAPNGKQHEPPKGTCWRYTESKIAEEISKNNIWFGKDGNGVPRIKKFLSEAKTGLTPETLWLAEDVGTNDLAKKHILELFHDIDLFDTPKPESLIQRILHIASNSNDLVLDSFLGSGTTAAVAHKMGRRYIGIEMGDHAQTHCIPRLQKVIDGEQGGISKSVNWTGGGGFSFVTLGEAVFDSDGHITQGVKFADLTAYIWWLETKTATGLVQSSTPFIGEHNGTAYYLLYNGILGDRRPNGGNVLTKAVLAQLLAAHPHTGAKVVFGESNRLGEGRMVEHNMNFKQIPYELHDRV